MKRAQNDGFSSEVHQCCFLVISEIGGLVELPAMEAAYALLICIQVAVYVASLVSEIFHTDCEERIPSFSPSIFKRLCPKWAALLGEMDNNPPFLISIPKSERRLRAGFSRFQFTQ
jgi:hypothetical protein